MSLGDAVEILLKSETLSDVERRCLNWHIANVEGPSAANINRCGLWCVMYVWNIYVECVCVCVCVRDVML